MHFSTVVSVFGLLASVASAAPRPIQKRQDSNGQVVVYWGQNGGDTVENNDLAAYCTSTSGIDILLLAFLNDYGNGQAVPSGTFGQSCSVNASGIPSNCDTVAAAITTCQQAGLKVLISLGGENGQYSLQSESQAQQLGQYLWQAYGNGGVTTKAVLRPFGSATVDGFDFDLEVNKGSNYYQYLIAELRSSFASDPSRTYWITGAPQCPIPEPNMGVIIQNSVFDKLWVQFYNNNPDCSLGGNGAAPFNYDSWVSFLATTPFSNTQLYIGVPAAAKASGSSSYYLTPSKLATLVGAYDTLSGFGGIMLWQAGFSDYNVNSGCTYAQEAHAILVSGSACSNGPVAGNQPTTTVTPTTLTTLIKSIQVARPTVTTTASSKTVPQ